LPHRRTPGSRSSRLLARIAFQSLAEGAHSIAEKLVSASPIARAVGYPVLRFFRWSPVERHPATPLALARRSLFFLTAFILVNQVHQNG
jgi:hypothetical protein